MICRLGRTAIYFFYGLDVEIRPKWTLSGSAPTLRTYFPWWASGGIFTI